mmetsp:Transcript_16643/g.30937  ORF Transcript_16643/g.30937 Transcript_16643/m.30937 type:complete len:276 (-) Transcript_16643:129-956(-)
MLAFTSLETFAVGWIDVTYVFKYGCFVTMMTGNLVQMGRSLALEGVTLNGAVFYLSLIFMFWLGVLSFRVLHHFVGQNHKRLFTALFLIYYALYLACYASVRHADVHTKWPVIFLPPMYGVHAALMLKGGLGKYPGIAMTSNSVNLNYFLFDVITKGWKSVPEKEKHHSYVLIGNFVGMCLGAACAGFWFRIHPNAFDTEIISIPPIMILVFIMLWNDSFFEQDTMDKNLRLLRESQMAEPDSLLERSMTAPQPAGAPQNQSAVYTRISAPLLQT